MRKVDKKQKNDIKNKNIKNEDIREVNNKINTKKIIIMIVIIIAIIYILFAVILLARNESDTVFVEQGIIHEEETVVGYIIRNENVIKNEQYKNGIIQIAEEGVKVSKDEPIFQYYSDEAKKISSEIEQLDLKIQETLKNEKITLTSDIKLIETQIEKKIENLRTLNNIQEISENDKSIRALFEKKITAFGKLPSASIELKKLIEQRNSYNEQIRNSTKYLTSPISGIVSYRIDGLEDKLTVNNFENIKSDYLEGLNLKTGQLIATSAEAGKVIDNFSYYIAVTMQSKEAMQTKVGKKVTIRLSTNDEIKAKIVHINEETEKRTIILKIDRMTENIINCRKISFDVIWGRSEGLKVPNKAIVKDEKGMSYVVRTRSGYLTKILVKIDATNENHSIVKMYSSEELTELGYTQQEISSYRKIKLYDEILLHPKLDEVK